MSDNHRAIERWAAELTHRLDVPPEQEQVWGAGLASPTLTFRSPPPELTEPIGELTSIEHRLLIKDVLARGGMGQIHSAQQGSIGRLVAIKRVLTERADPSARRGLIAEARATGRLEHPNIVPVYELGVDAEGAPALVMRRVDGVSWMEVLMGDAPMPSSLEGMDPLEAHLKIFDEVCLAVHFAHSRGLLHRDIKPDNVMIGSHGEVYLVDWGLAVRFDEQEHDGSLPLVAQISSPEGTPVYMAPEMVGVEPHKIGPRTDVYLLGATLHVVLTGSFRHAGQTGMEVLMAARLSKPFAYDAAVPAYLARVCNKATAPDHAARYDDVEALRRDVADYRRHLAAARQIDRAQEQRQLLDQLAHTPDLDDEKMALAYRAFGGAAFGFGQALEVWPQSQEAREGRDQARSAMFEIALRHGDLALCASLLKDLGGDPELAARLAHEHDARERERARVAELERLERDINPLADRRVRGRLVLTCAALLLCTNIVYIALNATAIAPLSPALSILYKLIDSLIIQCIIVTTLWRGLVNKVSRQSLYMFSLAVWSVASLRVVSVMIGLTLAQSGVIETTVYSIGVAAASILLDRRLLFIWPLSFAAALVSYFTTGFGVELRAAVNLSILLLLGTIWAMSRHGAEQTPSRRLT